jgi:parallel beta-helix repeat protein
MTNLSRRLRKMTAPRRPLWPRLALEPLENRAVPTTFTVTNLNDSGPGSLRQALADADAPGPDAIAFQHGLTGTITLAGQLFVNDSVTITGPGAGILTISGNNNSRIFEIDNHAVGAMNVAISGLTLTRGNAGALFGGAIEVADESLTLSGVVITANTTASIDGGGGGVFINEAGGLRLEDSVVSGNTATGERGSGGGLFLADSSTAVILRSIVSGNQRTGTGVGFGGGVFVGDGAVLNVENATISDNRAIGGEGGGILVEQSGSLIVENSTISGNQATSGGGGLLLAFNSGTVLRNSTISGNSSVSGGGGILTDNCMLTVENCTVSGNVCTSPGGGISFPAGGTGVIRNSTVAFNTAISGGGGIFVKSTSSPAAVTLLSTIVADNHVGATGVGPDVAGPVTSTFSLVANPTDATFAAGSSNNLTGIDPLLGPLTNNGGPTKTHALLPGSPAIGHGANIVGLSSDQRGFPFLRSSGAGVDIGAFEMQPNPGPTSQSIQAAVQAIQPLQRGGAHLAAFALGDVNGDFVNDIVLAFRLRNNKLLIATFDGIDGHIRGAFQPFAAPLRTDTKLRSLTVDVSADPGAEIVLLVTGAPGVPRLSVFTETGTRVL